MENQNRGPCEVVLDTATTEPYYVWHGWKTLYSDMVAFGVDNLSLAEPYPAVRQVVLRRAKYLEGSFGPHSP
jgi:hypothetical protein